MEFLKGIKDYLVDYFSNIEFSSSGRLKEWSTAAQNSSTVQNVNSVVSVIFKYGLIIGAIIFVVWVIWESEIFRKIYEGFMVMFWTVVFLIFFFVAMAAV